MPKVTVQWPSRTCLWHLPVEPTETVVVPCGDGYLIGIVTYGLTEHGGKNDRNCKGYNPSVWRMPPTSIIIVSIPWSWKNCRRKPLICFLAFLRRWTSYNRQGIHNASRRVSCRFLTRIHFASCPTKVCNPKQLFNKSSTVRLRHNAANGNNTFSIGSGQTGAFSAANLSSIVDNTVFRSMESYNDTGTASCKKL